MNLRMMTVGSVFFVAFGFLSALVGADDRGNLTNPLRAPHRTPAAENVPLPFSAQPPADSESPPRPQPGLWRNPGWFRPGDGPAPSGINPPPNATALPETPGGRDTAPPTAAPPPRTLIQRLRERRLAQLEKQAERLRELSQRDSQGAAGARNGVNPNGPENPDLQIDIGIPADPSAPADLRASPSGDRAPPYEFHPAWRPERAAPPAEASPPELNPPADPPIDIQIDIPNDLERPQPKPAAQARGRNSWSTPSR